MQESVKGGGKNRKSRFCSSSVPLSGPAAEPAGMAWGEALRAGGGGDEKAPLWGTTSSPGERRRGEPERPRGREGLPTRSPSEVPPGPRGGSLLGLCGWVCGLPAGKAPRGGGSLRGGGRPPRSSPLRYRGAGAGGEAPRAKLGAGPIGGAGSAELDPARDEHKRTGTRTHVYIRIHACAPGCKLSTKVKN